MSGYHLIYLTKDPTLGETWEGILLVLRSLNVVKKGMSF
jgi:hypothetical protein